MSAESGLFTLCNGGLFISVISIYAGSWPEAGPWKKFFKRAVPCCSSATSILFFPFVQPLSIPLHLPHHTYLPTLRMLRSTTTSFLASAKMLRQPLASTTAPFQARFRNAAAAASTSRLFSISASTSSPPPPPQHYNNNSSTQTRHPRVLVTGKKGPDAHSYILRLIYHHP